MTVERVRQPVVPEHKRLEKGPTRETDEDRAGRRQAPVGAAQTVRGAVRELQRTAGNTALRRVAGEPLDADVRLPMEEQLGADLGHVRVRAGKEANEDAAGVGAAAFAREAEITFAAGMYQPGTESGRIVLAHELAHVIQQTRNAGSSLLGSAALEAEADAAAVQGQPVVGSASPGTIQSLSEEEEEEERVRQARAAFPAESDRPVKVDLTPRPKPPKAPSPFDVPATPERVQSEKKAAAGPPRLGKLPRDVIAAVMADPGVKRVIAEEVDKVFEGVGRASTSEKVLVASVLVPAVVGGVATALVRDEGARELLDGFELPVPKVPWLRLKLLTKGGGGMIQVDVFKLATGK